jgi:protein-L-isoaspartate(D-aspartate) O-methyltransferase
MPDLRPNVALLAGVACLAVLRAALGLADDPLADRRYHMVAEQIAGRGIQNSELLQAMRATPRHVFLPAELQSRAYEDHALPIGFGATISQPYVVALMTSLLAPASQHRVLEIGTGSGYHAAILSSLVRQVYTIEIVPQLAQSAAVRLRELGHRNVAVRQGDGYKGWPEEAPFDRIILTAAPREIPEALIHQLASGGRLVAPVGELPVQELILIEKDSKGEIHRHSHGEISFIPMVRGRN